MSRWRAAIQFHGGFQRRRVGFPQSAAYILGMLPEPISNASNPAGGRNGKVTNTAVTPFTFDPRLFQT
jgi:hypothetical protein